MSELAELVQTVPDSLANSSRGVVAISTDCLQAHSRISRPLAWCEQAHYDTGMSQASSEDGVKAPRILASVVM